MFCHAIQREKETRIVQCLTYERDDVDEVGQDLTAVKGGPIFVPTVSDQTLGGIAAKLMHPGRYPRGDPDRRAVRWGYPISALGPVRPGAPPGTRPKVGCSPHHPRLSGLGCRRGPAVRGDPPGAENQAKHQ